MADDPVATAACRVVVWIGSRRHPCGEPTPCHLHEVTEPAVLRACDDADCDAPKPHTHDWPVIP